MIYSRSGLKIDLLRPATIADLKEPDDYDRQRMAYGQYAIGRLEGGKELVVDLATLKADCGIYEIHTMARAVGCDPQ